MELVAECLREGAVGFKWVLLTECIFGKQRGKRHVPLSLAVLAFIPLSSSYPVSVSIEDPFASREAGFTVGSKVWVY